MGLYEICLFCNIAYLISRLFRRIFKKMYKNLPLLPEAPGHLPGDWQRKKQQPEFIGNSFLTTLKNNKSIQKVKSGFWQQWDIS